MVCLFQSGPCIWHVLRTVRPGFAFASATLYRSLEVAQYLSLLAVELIKGSSISGWGKLLLIRLDAC